MTGLSAFELWRQAGGDRDRYRELMVEHGLLIPLEPGQVPQPLPCDWPARRVEATATTGPAPVTVARLREALERVDGALPVVLSKDPEGNGFRVLVDVDTARWHSGDGGWLDETDGGVPCVVLWPGKGT